MRSLVPSTAARCRARNCARSTRPPRSGAQAGDLPRRRVRFLTGSDTMQSAPCRSAVAPSSLSVTSVGCRPLARRAVQAPNPRWPGSPARAGAVARAPRSKRPGAGFLSATTSPAPTTAKSSSVSQAKWVRIRLSRLERVVVVAIARRTPAARSSLIRRATPGRSAMAQVPARRRFRSCVDADARATPRNRRFPVVADPARRRRRAGVPCRR